ncbi:hypothetical protein [Actinomadura flavalba]|uniref:hypothetical protein n=1 Tax=Actinomadura flavalba TaxID=1120938 RepID=UPI000366FC12|nr:hypothetical protein [Actinomadura flavalba]
MLRLHGVSELPARTLRIGVGAGAGPRAVVVADVLRRVAGRSGRRATLFATGDVPAPPGRWDDYGVAPFSRLDAVADVTVGPTGDLRVTEPSGVFPPSPGLRLALLETHYAAPLDLDDAVLAASADRLARWRALVADWATAPGRPLDRASVATAERALAADLDVPSALRVLDTVAASDLPPGARLETCVHLDLLFGLDLVAAIGT